MRREEGERIKRHAQYQVLGRYGEMVRLRRLDTNRSGAMNSTKYMSDEQCRHTSRLRCKSGVGAA